MEENITYDVLTVGNKKIPIRIQKLDQSILSFYPENPRVYSALNSDGSVPSQEDIEEHMKEMSHVRELKEDIRNNGGLIEEIIVRDRDFVVLEGNSRLAAYRLLCEKEPVKWAKIKCKVLPSDVDETLIFKLIGQYHIKGKKPWDAYEQASYLYRRCQQTKAPIDTIADELGIAPAKAKNMIKAVEMMHEKSEFDNHRYSYYFEYVKDANIKKFRDTNPDLDDVIAEQIQTGKIKEAEDIRKLAKVAKVGDKQSKKLIQQISDKKISVYDAYEIMEDDGKLDSVSNKLTKFREYINSDAFEKGINSSTEVNNIAKFEINKIIKRLTKIKEKMGN